MAESAPTVSTKGHVRGERSRFAVQLSARDLMAVAIFAVIYFVLAFAIAMIGIISPVVMLITMPLAPIVVGIPYMLFLARVKHAGMVTLFGVVIGLAFVLTGQPLVTLFVSTVSAVLAEFVLWAGRYRSRWAAIWTYTVYSIALVGPWIPLLTDRQAYLNSPGLQMMGPEYVAAFDQTVTTSVLLVLFVVMIVCAFLGGLLGSAVLRKHFVRAGLA